MAGDIKRAAPPALAVWLITRLAPTNTRQAILGDMHEIFTRKARQNLRAARRWYWLESMKTAPFLIWTHVNIAAFRSMILVLALTAVAMCITYIWDIFAARKAAQWAATHSPSGDLIYARSLYFLVFVIGNTFVGAMIAAVAFNQKIRFSRNVILCLGPIITLMITKSLLRFILTAPAPLLTYFALKILLATLALIGGAWCAVQYQNSSRLP